MARIHETGKGTPVDLRTAADLYLLAAEKGHLDAMCSNGYLLENGYATSTPDPSSALKWYATAADQGYARAQNAVGSCYYWGKGVKRDRGEAVVWYRRAAEQGDPHAQNNLGICYEEGSGVARDLVMAKTYYKMAADARHAGGVNNLGFLCMMEKDYMTAIKHFHLAMSLGSIDASYNLGTLYEAGCRDADGVVVNKDYEMAARFYREAADQGHTKSQTRLGTILLFAPPPLQNRTLAQKYLLKAASPPSSSAPQKSTPSATAQTLLGEIHELGLITSSPDYGQATKWYKLASQQGHAG
ncbi:hypothetical protein HK097_005395, partial [Rhizophlyctis rosea]